MAEGAVGAGTGMVCYDFKGGIGTSSRVARSYGTDYVVGVLVLANFGVRERLLVDGVPAGREISDLMPVENRQGSCIVVLATDAPLSSRQCARLAKRAALGLAQTGSYASDASGEIMLAFTTADRVPRAATAPAARRTLGDDALAELFMAAVDATAEAVVNSLCAGVTVEGLHGSVVHALPLERLVDTLARYGRPARLPTRGPGGSSGEAGQRE